MGVDIAGEAEGPGAAGEGVGGGAIHEAADGDEVGGAAGGGEDGGLKFGMGAGEVGEFLSCVGAAVVGEGDDAPVLSRKCFAHGGRWGHSGRGVRCDGCGLLKRCGWGGFVFVGVPGVGDEPGDEYQYDGGEAGADPEGTGGEGLVVGGDLFAGDGARGGGAARVVEER